MANPQRKRGLVPKYSKLGGLTVESTAGLASILKSIEKTGDLEALQLKEDPPPESIAAFVNSEKGETF